MPRKRKSAEAALKAKERKQKKLLIVLAPVFLGLAVWQGPKMYGTLLGGSPPPEAAEVTTAPTATTPVAPGTTPPPPAGQLADTEVPPEPNPAKLISFSLFGGKDPFLSPHPSTDPTAPAPTSSPSTPSSSSPSSGPGGSENEELTAVIEVNGVSETVSLGEEFPTSDPTFTLAALTLEGATIGVVQGMFETGEETIEIEVGEEVTLVAAPESTQYVVKLVDVLN